MGWMLSMFRGRMNQGMWQRFLPMGNRRRNRGSMMSLIALALGGATAFGVVRRRNRNNNQGMLQSMIKPLSNRMNNAANAK